MKTIYIILISFFLVSASNSAEEKCSMNILKSNCVFQKMTDSLGSKVKGTVKSIGSKSEKKIDAKGSGHVLKSNK